MKQILLRVPAVFAEIRFGELPQPLRRHFPSTRKIMLPQHALDPDIDRECSQPLIRKKHHAICNLRPHAWQRAQLFSELGIRQRRPSLEIRLAGADEPRRRTQIFRAIAKLAIEQFFFRSLCKSPRRSETCTRADRRSSVARQIVSGAPAKFGECAPPVSSTNK